MVESGWVILLPYVLSLADICISFEIGGEDWSWPGSTLDGLAVGYGHPGWELPFSDFPTPLLPLSDHPFPIETSVVHNHYHHIVGAGGPYGGPEGPVPHEGTPTPHEGLINGPLYQHFPTGHPHHPHHHGGHHHPSRDWYCHHAKKVKHLKKWLVKMLFCNLVY